MLDDIRYPMGIFVQDENLTQEGRSELIEQVLRIAPLLREMTHT